MQWKQWGKTDYIAKKMILDQDSVSSFGQKKYIIDNKILGIYYFVKKKIEFFSSYFIIIFLVSKFGLFGYKVFLPE